MAITLPKLCIKCEKKSVRPALSRVVEAYSIMNINRKSPFFFIERENGSNET